MSETHRPKTIDGYEVIGVEPDAACEYCGQRGDDAVYLMQGLFKGVGREPLHEACAGYWFEAKSDPALGRKRILARHTCPTLPHTCPTCRCERSIRCG